MMSIPPESNVFLSTATELQDMSSLTEEGKLYREAAKEVLARPQNKDAGPKEKDLILSFRSLDDLLKTVNDEREKNKLLNQKDPSGFSRPARIVVDTLSRFENAITSMAQAKAEIAMLIWGPIQFFVRVAGEIFDTLDRLIEIGDHLKHCLARYKLYTSGYNVTGPLRTSLVDFYAHIIQFSITTSQIYQRRRIKMAVYVFQTSIKTPFEQFLKGLDYLSGVIDKDANAESFQNIKSLRHTGPSLAPTPASAEAPQDESHFIVPDLLSFAFSGREDVLGCIRRSLHERQTCEIARTAIWGLPGIGKTQIALCYAKKYRDEYRNVFFINATSAETTTASYRSIARILFPDRRETEDPDKSHVDALIRSWLAKHRNWLLIYDNAIEPGAVRRYTPMEGSGHILFTTRNEIAADALVEKEEAYEVYALPPGQAISLVLRLQKIARPAEHEEKTAERLARMVLGVPIAIEQAVLLARLRKIGLPEIMPDIEKRRTLLKQSHPASLHENECSVGALVSMTLETLAADSPQAASLFQLLVYFDPSSIPIGFLTNASTELEYHFARLETYNRGLVRTPAEEREMQLQAAAAIPFYESNPFEKDFWKSRNPFRPKPISNVLPRVDSHADEAVERFFQNNRVLQDVLEKEVRIENALLDLRKAGLIRRPNDKTIWIHDMFAQLTIAIVEEQSSTLAQNVAHLVLLIIYLSFPIPNLDRHSDSICSASLPHAIVILAYCTPFYKQLTMGPELAHLTASAIHFFDHQKGEEHKYNTMKHYELAFLGYLSAWDRLKSHPHVTVDQIVEQLSAEYDLEDRKLRRHQFALHYSGCQRFGSSAASRAVQTARRIGFLYNFWLEHLKAVRWTTSALDLVENLYGELHDETAETRIRLVGMYKNLHEWNQGYALGRLVVRDHMRTWGGGLLSRPGASNALDVGDCALGLGWVQEAENWYQVALRGIIFTFGENDREQMDILLKLADLERVRHNHSKSLEYVLKLEKIWQGYLRQSVKFPPLPNTLSTIHEVIAMQYFEMGVLDMAKEWCERALQGPKLDPVLDNYTLNKRTYWDMRLEAVWLWGCLEHRESDVQEWDIPGFDIPKDLSREALSKFGPFKSPCCAGVHGGEAQKSCMSVSRQLQGLLEELDQIS